MVFGGEKVRVLLDVVVVAKVASERLLGKLWVGKEFGGNLTVPFDEIYALQKNVYIGSVANSHMVSSPNIQPYPSFL